MGIIRELTPSVVSQIAAGQVIERPCYAVKELVENALDAQARLIHIDLVDGGLEKITVTDDGVGMDKDDINQCFKPHTTSKIISSADLHTVSTLGFRGEALASLAAVSTLDISSRPQESSAGWHIRIVQNALEISEPVGMPAGTRVIAHGLFADMPARRKFVRAVRTELRRTVECVLQLALSRPDVRFILEHDGKILCDLLPTSDEGRTEQIVGTRLMQKMIPIRYEEPHLAIKGYITAPQHVFAHTRKQYVIVNNRPVSDSLIAASIKEGYSSSIPRSAHPTFIVYLTVPPAVVDVNVHPRKEHLHIIHAEEVMAAIKHAVAVAVSAQSMRTDTAQADRPVTEYATGSILKEMVQPWDMRNFVNDSVSTVFQLDNLYLVTATRAGIIVFDQHAAHERILYEQFREAFENKRYLDVIHRLDTPLLLDLAVPELILLEQHKDFFAQAGFEIDFFQGTSAILRHVPALFADRNHQELIHELLQQVAEAPTPQMIDIISDTIIQYLACRAAVKAGDRLTSAEALQLIEKLRTTPRNTTCPHGRPTKIEFSLFELHRLFKRK